jgi:FMN phosphatase YigB (HAD superfamily)
VREHLEEIAEEIHLAINHEKANVALEPSVIPLLETLRQQGATLGVLSNGYPCVECWLVSLNIRCYFKFVLISSSIGHLKPCPFAFVMALQQKPQDRNDISVYVGDDWHTDGFAAIHAGFDISVVVNQDSRDTRYRKILHTPTLSLIPEILRHIKRSGSDEHSPQK